mgnify:CR=1 FL=1
MSQKEQDEQTRGLYREWAAEMLKILEKHRSSYADWQERAVSGALFQVA